MLSRDVDHKADIAIIGAGITGLCTAHQLQRQNQSFTLFDSGPNVGGAIQSSAADGYLAEHGPNSLLVKDKRVHQLLSEIGLDPESSTHTQLASETAKKRYIVHEGMPHAMPASPLGMLKTPLFSPLGKLRFALEPFIGRYHKEKHGGAEESFADFVRRRLGPDMLASAAGPFVSGIYAGDPENLSVRHAFPRLWNLEHHYGSFILGALAIQFGIGPISKNPHRHAPSQMLSFREGMHQLPAKIAEHLAPCSIRLNTQLTRITRKDGQWLLNWTDSDASPQTGRFHQVVLAVPHHALSQLPLPSSCLDALAPLAQIQSPPVSCLVLGFKRSEVEHPLDGFGMLIKQSEQSPLLGVLFSSSMFAHRAPDDHVTLTCMMGGSQTPDYATHEESTVLKELGRLLGVTGQPTFRHRTSWQHAIPQYDLQYQGILDAMESCEQQHPGLHLAGNYRGGISVGDCIVNGLKLGQQLSA